LGFITMWPQGQTQPLAATLNDTDGRLPTIWRLCRQRLDPSVYFPWHLHTSCWISSDTLPHKRTKASSFYR
jgi:hypothetical protein